MALNYPFGLKDVVIVGKLCQTITRFVHFTSTSLALSAQSALSFWNFLLALL